MNKTFLSPNAAVTLSGAALLSFLGRSFLDYYAVMPEFGVSPQDLLPITLVMLAFYAGWLWALVNMARSRRALAAAFAYNVLLVVFGVSTFTALCPSPCPTAWPLGEILMWTNVIIGVPAAAVTAYDLFSYRKASTQAVSS